MQVTCNACHRSMNIPDKKLPKDHVFSITCPECKTKFKVDQHLKPKESAPISPPPKEKEETVGIASMVVNPEEFEDDEGQAGEPADHGEGEASPTQGGDE